MYNLIRHWLSLTINNPVTTHDGVGEVVGQKLGVFYANNGIIRSRNPKNLQGDINVLIVLFKKIYLKAKIMK